MAETSPTISTSTPLTGAAVRVAELTPGTSVGRYLLLERVGEGGMGVVYSAYDPTLDRKVALKLVGTRTGQDANTQRLVREATALAKLAHPNIVVVHEVGHAEQGVYIAMEYVVGVTLGTWIEQQRPGWRRIVDMIASVS